LQTNKTIASIKVQVKNALNIGFRASLDIQFFFIPFIKRFELKEFRIHLSVCNKNWRKKKIFLIFFEDIGIGFK
jgi:hypothetical protein